MTLASAPTTISTAMWCVICVMVIWCVYGLGVLTRDFIRWVSKLRRLHRQQREAQANWRQRL